MLKHILMLFLFIMTISFTFGAQIDIKANVYTEYTLFTYQFVFNDDENYKSFSFEKPSDAKLDYSIDDLGNTVKTNFAGDYFIVQPLEDTKSRVYEVRFISKLTSENIISKNSFSQYTNFNFPVEKLVFTFKLENDFGDIEEYFPRSYEEISSNEFRWTINKVETDTLFLVNFQGNPMPIKSNSGNLMYWLGWIILITILLSLIAVYILLIKNKDSSKSKNINTPSTIIHNTINSNEVDNNKYEEITSKYLTENEKEIVEVIKDNQGISQYDILNYLPNITKSNLSKIISKLNSKRILSRIRVGKVNKIYLGEKLEKTHEDIKSKKE